MRTKIAALPAAACLLLAGGGSALAQDAYPPPENQDEVSVLPGVIERPQAPAPDAEPAPADDGVDVAPEAEERPAPGAEAAPADEVAQPAGLALTGIDALLLGVAALAALAVGGLVLVRSRRRTAADS